MRTALLACACCVSLLLGVNSPGFAQQLMTSDGQLDKAINQLGDFDFDVRTQASRLIRRMSLERVEPSLVLAVLGHEDGYVRFRALVLLTGFGQAAADVIRAVISDPNDRLRAVAYGYLEHYPDPAMVEYLLAALETETSEFVRPALIRALASHTSERTVRSRLIADIDRGVDFFRGAVIEALGDRGARYAVGPLMNVARESGPLQDDALLALAKIGDQRILPLLATLQGRDAELEPVVSGVASALGVDRLEHMRFMTESLSYAVSAGDQLGLVSASAAGLGVVASKGDADAIDGLIDVAIEAPVAARERIAIVLASLAMRQPSVLLAYLEMRADLEAAILVVRDGFDILDEDLAEERFFMTARASFWANPEGSRARSVAGRVIELLEF
ncbi:MAG: hypothetical protein CL484_10295 [Acidobacteria bacterium]|nr:hypothetical protein [Acidobacteriota bacterium]|tara:strand:- start:4161 stop:5327 length:1167 start_codon:yes stop_codon:yes gene_type:complete